MNSKNKKLKVAIAGLGFGKKVHLEALKESNYLTPVAIYHYDKKQKSILEKETGLEFFHDWEDLVKSQEIDGIIIATPPESRFKLAKRALENNKNLLLEKPVSISSSEIEELQRISLINNLSVCVDFEYRAVPLFLQTKKLFDENIFLYFEENDFYERCLKKEKSIFLIENSKINHKGNSSVKEKKWPNSSSVGSSLKKALDTGNVQIISNYLVESFEINKITELASKLTIVNLENGHKEVLDCDLILLCASTISTLRILLNSEYKSNSAGFKDNSGKLGKYLMDHISICRFFSVPKAKNSDKSLDNPPDISGAGSFFIPFGSNLPEIDDIKFHRGYGIWGAIDRLGIPKFLQKDANKSIGFLIAHGEVLPREKNSVSLSRKTDKWGIPIPYIEFEWSENELNMAKHMEKTIQKSVKAANGKIKNIDELINIPLGSLFTKNLIALSDSPPPPGYYIHEVGGAPMGLNEDNSVVDKFNRLWRCKNVLILDGACWPTSSWQSPTLTMMALSRRACLNIKKS